jgi:hypothetical protein
LISNRPERLLPYGGRNLEFLKSSEEINSSAASANYHFEEIASFIV